jgi:hypothetical protein
MDLMIRSSLVHWENTAGPFEIWPLGKEDVASLLLLFSQDSFPPSQS